MVGRTLKSEPKHSASSLPLYFITHGKGETSVLYAQDGEGERETAPGPVDAVAQP